MSLRLDLFGRPVLVERRGGGWQAYYLGVEGKRRPAHDMVIPDELSEAQIPEYLADLCHEWASERHPTVRRIR